MYLFKVSYQILYFYVFHAILLYNFACMYVSKIITVYVCKKTLVHLDVFGNYDLIKTSLEKMKENSDILVYLPFVANKPKQ